MTTAWHVLRRTHQEGSLRASTRCKEVAWRLKWERINRMVGVWIRVSMERIHLVDNITTYPPYFSVMQLPKWKQAVKEWASSKKPFTQPLEGWEGSICQHSRIRLQ